VHFFAHQLLHSLLFFSIASPAGCCTINLVFFPSLHCLSYYLCLVCFLMHP
jgi:hypothetical protein